MEVLLVEPSIVFDAVFPSVFFEDEIVVENVLSTDHFAFFPMRLVEAALSAG